MSSAPQPTTIFVFFDLGVGGVQRKLSDLLAYSTQKEVTLLLERRRFPEFDFSHQRTRRKINVIYKEDYFVEIPLLGRKSIGFTLFLFVWFLVHRYDVVYTFLPKLCLTLAIIKKLFFWKPFTLVCSQDVIFSDNTSREKWPLWMIRLYSLVSQSCDLYLVPSTYAAFTLAKRYPALIPKIVVGPNWSLFKPTKNQKKLFDCCIITRFDTEKNIEGLVIFLRVMEKIRPGLRVLLVGSGSESQRLKKQLKSLTLTMKLVELTTNTRYYFEQSKILLSFSKSEGMPMAFLEAMATQTVIVAQSYPGIRDVIRNDSQGYVCRSVAEMVIRVNNLLDKPTLIRRIAQTAQRRQQNYFSQLNLQYYSNLNSV